MIFLTSNSGDQRQRWRTGPLWKVLAPEGLPSATGKCRSSGNRTSYTGSPTFYPRTKEELGPPSKIRFPLQAWKDRCKSYLIPGFSVFRENIIVPYPFTSLTACANFLMGSRVFSHLFLTAWFILLRSAGRIWRARRWSRWYRRFCL